MTGYISNEIKAPLTSELLQYAKDNLEIDNPDYIQKQKMNLYIGKTPKKLSLYKINMNEIILPFGCLKEVYPLIKDNEIVTDFPEIPIKISGKVPVYDYQEIAVNTMLKAKNGILVSRAGSGKTQMAIELINRIGKKTLWLTHTVDLLKQSRDRANQYLKCEIGEITAGKVNIKDITFATIQTISNLDLQALKNEFSVIIIDECHRVAGSPTKLTMFSKVINSLSARYKIGLTATAHRADGMIKSMFALIGDIAYEVPENAVEDKTIKAEIVKVDTNYELSLYADCIDTDGTIIFSKFISELCGDLKRNKIIASKIQSENEYSLVLSDRIEQLNTLRDLIGHGVVIDGKTNKQVREKAIQDVREGKEKILFASYSLAKEGLDIPRLTRLYMSSPKKDLAVIIQSVGRIERTFKGKDKCIVYDFVDNIGLCVNMWKSRRKIYKNNKNILTKNI